jgi:hypothetical protein
MSSLSRIIEVNIPVVIAEHTLIKNHRKARS